MGLGKMKSLSAYKKIGCDKFDAQDLEKIKPVLELIESNTNDLIRTQIIDEVLVAISPQFNGLQWDYISDALLYAAEAAERYAQQLNKIQE